MLSFEEAKELAYQFVNEKYNLGADDEILILGEETRETSDGWIFQYNSRKYLETGNTLFMMQVNYPIIVNKADGTCVLKRQGLISNIS